MHGAGPDGVRQRLEPTTGVLVESVRERIERLGRPLHAVVAVVPPADRGDAARGALADGDEPVGAEQTPLAGLPMAVKDMVDVAGFPRGNGNPHAMTGPPAARDAPVVAALRRAGADVVALAAMLEYAAGAQHPDLPEVRNPVDSTLTAGGSSGGSAALVGAGAVPAALGSDTGGSIRVPAHYCGVVGFKPTHGRIDLTGVTPLAPTLDHLGTLAVDVATTARVFAVLAATSNSQPLPHPPLHPHPPRIGLLRGQLDDPRLDEDVALVLEHAVARLQAATHVESRDAAPVDALNEPLGDVLLFEAWQVHGDRMRRDPGHYGPETARLLRAAAAVTRERYEAALTRRAALVPPALAQLDGIDVLLGPAAPFVAPEFTPPIDTPQGEVEGVFSGPYDVSGQPAIVLPCGRTRAGLPVGLQLAAAPGADAALLAAASWVEQVLARP